jgi:hypothetical protein
MSRRTEATPDLLTRAKTEGVGPGEVLEEILCPRWPARRFNNNAGKPLRELGVGAKFAVAHYQDMSGDCVLRTPVPDPPDVIVEGKDRVWCFEVVEVLEPGAMPNLTAIQLEDETAAFHDAQTKSARQEGLAVLQKRGSKLPWSPSEQRLNDHFSVFISAAARRLEKKATKYAQREKVEPEFAARGRFGLLLHNSTAHPNPPDWTSPIRWADWLTPEQRSAAEWFTDIVVVDSDTIKCQNLVLRRSGQWLVTPESTKFTDHGRLAVLFGGVEKAVQWLAEEDDEDQCEAIKRDKRRCSRRVRDDELYCWQHRRKGASRRKLLRGSP